MENQTKLKMENQTKLKLKLKPKLKQQKLKINFLVNQFHFLNTSKKVLTLNISLKTLKNEKISQNENLKLICQ